MASSGSSIVNNITNGLTNTYAYLASLYPKDGVTLKNITSARSDNTNYLTLNQSFASYLQNNFSSFDKDGDGKISADEMNKFATTISRSGVSRDEISQLAMTGACSKEMVTKILENFDDIDTNHDGRVTSAEISAYTYSSQKQAKLDESNYRKATTDMSIFYTDDSSTDVTDYSILSYKYKNFNK